MRVAVGVVGNESSGKRSLLEAAATASDNPNEFSASLSVSGIDFAVTLVDAAPPSFPSLLPTLSAVIFVYNLNNSASLSFLTDPIDSWRASSKLPLVLLGNLSTGRSVSAALSVDYSGETSPSLFPFSLETTIKLAFNPIGEFLGQTVVITGGAMGIGKCLTLEFAKRGAAVYPADVDSGALDIVKAEFPARITPVVCDVSVESDVRNLARVASSATGAIDVVINDAGISDFAGANIFEDSMDGFDRVIAVNLRGTFMTAKYCSPHMRPGAAIVNIASSRAIMSEPKTEGYSASKGGIVALTHAMAMSLAPRGIRVNSVSPGWIDVSTWRPGGVQETLTEQDHAQHPVGRVGVPQDIAEMCMFLASKRAGFITGQNHVVDGGMTRKMIYAE